MTAARKPYLSPHTPSKLLHGKERAIPSFREFMALTAPLPHQTPLTPANSINSTQPGSPLDKALPSLPKMSSRCSSVYSVDTPVAEYSTEQAPLTPRLSDRRLHHSPVISSPSWTPLATTFTNASTVSLLEERSPYSGDIADVTSHQSLDQTAQLARTVTIRVLRAPPQIDARRSTCARTGPSPTHSRTASWPSLPERLSDQDFKLMPPPALLPHPERPISRFSLNSDEDDSEHGVSRASSFLSHFTRRSSARPTERRDSREAASDSRKRRPTWSPIFGPKPARKKNRLGMGKGKVSGACHRFTDAYLRRSRMGSASSVISPNTVVLSNSARSCAGPSTPFPGKHYPGRLPSPSPSKRKAIASLQEGAESLKFVMGKARVKCMPTANERWQKKTKKNIRVLNEGN